jgi:hypothetical protein
VEKSNESESVTVATPLSQDFKRGSRLALTPYYTSTTLSVTDATTGNASTLASQLGGGANLQYFQIWTEKFQSFVGLSLGEVSFTPPTTAGKTLDNRTQIMSGISLGGNFVLSRDFTLSTSAKYQTELFARAVSTTEAAVDGVMLPSVEAKISYDLITLSPFTFGISGVSDLIFPGSTDGYSVRLGESYGGTMYLREEDYQTELGFFTRSQNTSLVHQTENDLRLSVRIFFGGTKPK